MLGPIEFSPSFKPTDFGTGDFPKRSWRHVVEYDPGQIASKLQVELLSDFEATDPISGVTVTDEPNRKFRVFDLSYGKGKQVEAVERDIHNFMQVKMNNFAPDEPIRVLNHYLMQTPKVSR